MTVATEEKHDWPEAARTLAEKFKGRAPDHDAADKFVEENYNDLKAARAFSAVVPADLGGGGLSYAGLCDFLRVLGQGCGSTALAFSMHSHILAALVWRWRHMKAPVEPLLRRV